MTYPLATPTPSLLLTCDPAIYWALEFYSAVLVHHVGPALVAAAASCGAPITSAVASRIHYDPGPHLLMRPENRFPLLAVYRSATRYTDRTVTWSQEESDWGIAYVLPALAPAQADRILPILRAVATTIQQTTDRGLDPAFLVDDEPPVVWDAAHGGVSKIDLVEGSYGTFDDSRGLPFHAWFGKARVTERVMPLPGSYAPFQGADAGISSVNANEDEVVVVELKSDLTPPAAG